MSDLSDRLSRAKDELGISTRQISAAAERAGYKVSNATAAVYTNGKHGKPDAKTVEALSVVLRVPLVELRRLAGLPQVHGKFDPVPEADTLTAPQRNAVNEIIRQLAEANTRAGDGDAEATPTSRAGVSPAAGEDDGLGAFGGRARGDLDNEDINDGAGDNVYSIVPPPPASDTAAYRAPNRGKKQKDEADKRGEESQDADGDDGGQDPEGRE